MPPSPSPPDEPRNHPLFLFLVALTSLAAVPFVFIGGPAVFVLGIPIWLWWSVGFTIALAAVTAWGILRFWKDDRLD